MRVLIIGAGIGGLTLAAFLRKNGHDVLIVEKRPQVEHLGFVIGMWPNGTNTLGHLGIAERIRRAGKLIKRHKLLKPTGKELLNFSFGEFNKLYGTTVELERSKLFEFLLGLNKETAIRFSCEAKEFTQDTSGVDVTFSDDSREKFDLVVGADGVNSRTRSFLFPKLSPSRPRWKGYVFWVPKSVVDQHYFVSVHGSGTYFGLYPTRKEDKSFCVMVTSHLMPEDNDPATSLRKHFGEMRAMVPAVLENLPERIVGVEDTHVTAPKYSVGRMVLIGDALRTSSPILGMGASMAIEDAYVLADELQHNSVSKALEKYESRRRKRYRTIQLLSWMFVKVIDYSRFMNGAILFTISHIYKPVFVRLIRRIIKNPP